MLLQKRRHQLWVLGHPILAKGGLVSQRSVWVKTIPVTRVSVCVLRCDPIGSAAHWVKRPTCADPNEVALSF